MVIFASSRVNATPEMRGCSIPFSSSSGTIIVPGPSSNEDSTRSGTRYLLANSIARIWSTFAPRLASSSISSNVSRSSRRALGSILGSAVYTPSTSV